MSSSIPTYKRPQKERLSVYVKKSTANYLKYGKAKTGFSVGEMIDWVCEQQIMASKRGPYKVRKNKDIEQEMEALDPAEAKRLREEELKELAKKSLKDPYPKGRYDAD